MKTVKILREIQEFVNNSKLHDDVSSYKMLISEFIEQKISDITEDNSIIWWSSLTLAQQKMIVNKKNIAIPVSSGDISKLYKNFIDISADGAMEWWISLPETEQHRFTTEKINTSANILLFYKIYHL